MGIQWFPGHMSRARTVSEKTMRRVNLVLELVDARIPAASSNPMVEEMYRRLQRNYLKILNKVDLADEVTTAQWVDFYDSKSVNILLCNCKEERERKKIWSKIHYILNRQKSPGKSFKVMIVGVPNVGKSTLFNLLLGRKIAKVADLPAITRREQILESEKGAFLIDTPGLMWPKIESELDGVMLAAMNSIGPNAMLKQEIALGLANILSERYAGRIEKFYNSSFPFSETNPVLDFIAEKRGAKLKGGVLDLEKAADILLRDCRLGRLGKVSLESPGSRLKLMEAL